MAISDAALLSEIQTDPLSPQLGYAGKTAQEIADILNKKGSDFVPPKTGATWTLRDGVISAREIRDWAAVGPWVTLKAAAAAVGNTNQVRSMCEAFLALIGNISQQGFNIDAPGMTTVLNNMRAAGTSAFTQGQQDSLVALGDISCSRAEKLANQLGYIVTLNDVARVVVGGE